MRLILARIAVLIAATVMAGAAAAQYQPPNDRVDFATYEPQQVLAQKPLGVNYAQAKEIVRLCRRAKIQLVVDQNMPPNYRTHLMYFIFHFKKPYKKSRISKKE